MSAQLQGNFTFEFFGDINNPEVQNKPTNIVNAIASMKVNNPKKWTTMTKELFPYHPEHTSIDDIYIMILETNTVDSFLSPVSVYIDLEGYYSILVYNP